MYSATFTTADPVASLTVSSNTGHTEHHLSNPDDVLEDIQKITQNMLNPENLGLNNLQHDYKTESKNLSAIANYVQVHVGDLSTVSINGLRALLKIARSDSSATYQSQCVLHDLLVKNSLSPLIRPAYFEMCACKRWVSLPLEPLLSLLRK